ncbi:hypothetical protein HPB52_011967 [Rhipicephalus sanguineus]|uniref:RNase H type-1 domain-containing protein n=1 Tax=Rhipicephalus sanguineus TaxID=34632 RepID=A0A9D4PP05_RHISA|nr:hypothetical protein HPB52_011967 [Rhipicephalus sanguineus]
MLQRALGHIDRLHRAADGRTLLERLRSQPRSRMGGLCQLYHQMVPDPPVPVARPPPHHRPPEVHLSLDGATKRCTPAAALQQAAACKLQEQLEGRLQVFTDGSVMPDGTAAAACVIPSKAISRQCRLPFPASSTAAELAGLHLAADLLAEDIPAVPIAVLCDSKAALQTLANHRRAGLTGNLLETKFRALTASGASVSFHWLPSHVGIAGDEEADRLSTPARHHLLAGPPEEAPRHNPPGPEGGQRAGTKASPRDGPHQKGTSLPAATADRLCVDRGPPLPEGSLRLPSLQPLRRPRDPRANLYLPRIGKGTLDSHHSLPEAGPSCHYPGAPPLPIPSPSTSAPEPGGFPRGDGNRGLPLRPGPLPPPPPPILAAGLLLFVLMTSVPPHL